MDDFKKYMQQRVEELDTDVPRERVWQAINQNLQPEKRSTILVYMKWAVAACIIGLAGFGLYKFQDTNVKPPFVSASQQKQAIEVPVTETQKVVAVIKVPNDYTEVPSSKLQVFNKIQNIKHKIQNNKTTTNNNQLVLQQVENTFTQVINLQRAKVNTTPLNAENPSYFNDFIIEIKRMERDEQGIKKDISKSGLTDELLDQLINIYQQKLNVLKQLQNEIHKTNNRFKQNRIPSDTTKTYFLNI